MIEVISVFLGGSLGASLRYLISIIALNYGWTYQGTFVANMLGCLFLGFVIFIAAKKEGAFHPVLKLFLTTGVAGGFTTFSAFSYEAFILIKAGSVTTGIIYMVLSLVLGLLSTLFGIFLAKKVLEVSIKIDDSQTEEKIYANLDNFLDVS